MTEIPITFNKKVGFWPKFLCWAEFKPAEFCHITPSPLHYCELYAKEIIDAGSAVHHIAHQYGLKASDRFMLNCVKRSGMHKTFQHMADSSPYFFTSGEFVALILSTQTLIIVRKW